MRLLNNTFEPRIQLLQLFSCSLINQFKRIAISLILLISLDISGYSQDCLHDTIPPEIFCKQDFIYRSGWCGNDLVFASEFVTSATDNCSQVSITFDREGKMRYVELGMFMFDPKGPFQEISIFARDTSGNVSECISTYKMVPQSISEIFTCDLISGFKREVDKIQLKVRTNTNSISLVELIGDRVNSLQFRATIDGMLSVESLILEANEKPFINYDISLIDQIETLYFIIGQGKYLSPVNFISADADCNGEINLLDIYQTRKYLEQIPFEESCLGKPVLYFIDKKGNILGKEIPYQKNSISPPIIAYNIKGEINRYLPDPGIALINPVNKFAGDPLIWNATDINCIKGNQYAVEFTLSDYKSLFGLQCNFRFNPDLIEVEKINTNFNNHNIKHIYSDDIQLAWLNISNPKFENDYPKATILFAAKSDFKLSDAFKPSEQTISNFAITSDGTVRPIVTEFSIINAAENEDKDRPWIKVSNTSSDHTVHIFGSITQFNEAELLIHNIYGQTIYNQKIRTSDGQFNEFVQLSNPGVYLLDLKLPNRKQLVQAFVVVR